MQLLLVHDSLGRFSGNVRARSRTQSCVQRMAILLVMDGPPRSRREPSVLRLLPEDRASVFMWNDVCVATSRQKEVLEGWRHRIEQPGHGGEKVDSASGLHEVFVR